MLTSQHPRTCLLTVLVILLLLSKILKQWVTKYFRSQHLLNLPPDQVNVFIEKYVAIDPVKKVPITCLTTINRNSHQDFAVSCPVVGTEHGMVYILDPQTFGILYEVSHKTDYFCCHKRPQILRLTRNRSTKAYRCSQSSRLWLSCSNEINLTFGIGSYTYTHYSVKPTPIHGLWQPFIKHESIWRLSVPVR